MVVERGSKSIFFLTFCFGEGGLLGRPGLFSYSKNAEGLRGVRPAAPGPSQRASGAPWRDLGLGSGGQVGRGITI